MLKKSVILVFCIFVLSLVIIGCGGGGGSSNPVGPTVLTGTTASLSGTVIYDEAPLANAAVYLYKSEKAYAIGVAQLPSFRGSLLTQELVSDGAYSTTTNAEGIYNFVNIPVGQYTLIAVKDENHQFAQTGVLLGAVTTLNPQLTPTGKISGKVTVTIGGTTQNIAGAIVYISGTSYVAITDASGNFLINNVPSNTLTTGASYEVQVSANQGTAAAKTSITVSPGATTNVGTFELAAPISNYKRITGTLVAGAGATSADLANIFVVLTRVDDGSLVGNYTNTNGSYTFTVTKTGNYAVVAVDTDYAFTPPTIGVNVPALDNTTMTLSSISITPRQIANTGSIIGTVSAAGSPLAGAVVHITGTSLLSVSNSTGNFVIEKVPANTVATPSYTVEVSSNMGTATAKTAVVNVSQATDIGNFAIAMPAAGYKTIVGTLTAVLPVTQPELTGKLVQLTAPDGKVSAAYSNAVGGFSFMATQTGAHSLTVMDNEFAYAPRTQNITIVALDNATQALGAINASTSDNTGSISGQVTSAGLPVAPSGSPIAGAIVNVVGTSLLGVSDLSGNFVIEKVPANTLATAYTIEVSSNRGTAPSISGVVVNVGQSTTENFAIAMPAAGYKTIVGTLTAVLPVTQPELTSKLVQLTAPDGKVSAAYSNAVGGFSFMATQTGAHSLTVMDNEFAYAPRTQSIAIAALDNAAQTLGPINASTSDNTGSIIGTVSAAGLPLAGAVVHITGTSLLSVSNSTGNFVIEKVPANTVATPSYNIEVSSNKGSDAAKTAVVNIGQTVDIGAFAVTMPTAGYKTIVGTLTAVLPVTQPELTSKLVQLTAPDGKVSAAYSNAVGGFSFMATQTGAHSLTVMDNEFAYAPRTQSIAIAALDNAAQTLGPINASTSDNTGSIIGTVSAAGLPLAGAVVHITGTSLLSVSNSTGNFVIEKVPANTVATPSYNVEVSSNKGSDAAKTAVVNIGQTVDIGAFAVTMPTAGYKTIVGTLTAVLPVTQPELTSKLVQLTAPDGKVSAAYSNAAGGFSFITTQTGAHSLTVMDNDFVYAPRTQNITIAALDNATQALSTINASTSDNTGSISGQVTSAGLPVAPSGSPIAGAIVNVVGTSLLGVSDLSGNFVIEKVPANTLATAYTIEVSSNRGTASAISGVVVNVGQSTTENFAIAMPAAGYKTIVGTLTAVLPVTQPELTGKLVQLTAPDGKVSAAYSNAAGGFSFITTQAGAHSLTVMDNDFVYAPRTQSITIVALDNASQALGPINASTSDNTGSISGQVTSAGLPVAPSGSPISGAIVNVVGTSLLGVSDLSGNFVIEKVPANTFATAYTIEVSSNRGTASAISGVVVNVGQSTTENFAIAMPPAGYKTIVGTLTAVLPVTQPELTNKLVQLTAPDGKVSAAYSNAAGEFSFMATQTGDHSLTVMDNEFAYAPRTQNITIAALDNATQALGPINASNPNFQVNVSGTIAKLVKIKPEINESGVSVFLTQIPAGNPRFNTFTNDLGSFTFMMPPGTYSLSIGSPYKLDVPTVGDPVVISADYAYPSSIAVRPIDTINSAIVGSVTWAIPPVGWLTTDGEVVLQNQTGTPVFFESRSVGVTPSTFRFDNIPPGSYTLRTDPAKNGFDGTVSISVVEGIDITNQTLPTTFVAPFISPTPSVSGNVLTLTGQVYYASPNTQALVNNLILPATGSWTLPTIARFDIANLTPGTHTVQLVNTFGSFKVNGNIASFSKLVMPPAIIATPTTDNSATVTWQNAPFVSEVEIELWTVAPVAQVGGINLSTGQSFTFNNLLPDTDYEVRIRSRYNNLVSITAQETFRTNKGINSFELSGTGTMVSSGEIFGFAVSNNNIYVGANYSTGGTDVRKFDMTGGYIDNYSWNSPPAPDPKTFDLVATNDNVYIIHPGESTQPAKLVRIVHSSFPATASELLFDDIDLPVMTQAKMEFHGNYLFVSTTYEGDGYRSMIVTRLNADLTSKLEVFSFTSFDPASSGNYHVKTTSDGTNLYVAYTNYDVGYNNLELKDLGPLSSPTSDRLITTIPTFGSVADLKYGNGNLYVRNPANAYSIANTNSGYTTTYPGYAGGIYFVGNENLWVAESTSSGNFYYNLKDLAGNIKYSENVIAFPATEEGSVTLCYPAEFIKSNPTATFFMSINDLSLLQVSSYDGSL